MVKRKATVSNVYTPGSAVSTTSGSITSSLVGSVATSDVGSVSATGSDTNSSNDSIDVSPDGLAVGSSIVSAIDSTAG